MKLTALMNSKLSFYNAGVRLVCLVTARRAVLLHSVFGRSRPDVIEVTSSRKITIPDRHQMADDGRLAERLTEG